MSERERNRRTYIWTDGRLPVSLLLEDKEWHEIDHYSDKEEAYVEDDGMFSMAGIPAQGEPLIRGPIVRILAARY